MAEHKRHCKREEGSVTDAASDASEKPFWEEDDFLAELTRHLVGSADVDLAVVFEGWRDLTRSHEDAAKLVHDALAEHWNDVQVKDSVPTQDLLQKQDAWARAKRSPGAEASAGRGEKPASERA